MTETIFALSSAPGRAAVAVVRLSGPAAGAALRALAGGRPPAARRASLRRLCHPGDGRLLDRALVLWLPAPGTETGEDMAELHLHGSPAVVAAVLEALGTLPGLRPAEAGEFTRRAFDHGRLDLTAVEGLADLVAAETEAQRRQALRQLEGELGRLYDSWRERLVAALARLEAAIDFPEEDLPTGLEDEIYDNILWLKKEIAQHMGDDRRGERLREGIAVALLGAPNVGKSTFLNRLARREAAIVSATAGTTRDIVEVRLDLAGYPLLVADTAGLREPEGEIEAEGVRRALARAAEADLKILLFDATALPAADAATLALAAESALLVANKADLLSPPLAGRCEIAGRPAWLVSLRTGAGLDALLEELARAVAARYAPGEAPALTRQRHRAALEAATAALDRAAGARSAELMAEDLRLAARALGRITGRVDVEELLDAIFREFCIGK